VRSRHARHIVVAAVTLLASLVAVVAGLASSAGAQTSTTLSLTVSPTGVIAELTPVTFHVVVTPSTATGTVAMIANGSQIASAILTKGSVDLTVSSMAPGSQNVQATFYPADAAAYSSSASAAQVVQVVAQGQITMTVVKGKDVSPGGPVAVGATVAVVVTGFPASSSVTAVLDTTGITSTFATDSSGAGHLLVFLPRTLGSRVYRLTASSGRVVSTFTFYIYNPYATPSPTPTPARSSAPAVVATATAAVAGIRATGATPELAHTGTDVAEVVPAALVLLVGGTALMSWSRNLGRSRGRHAGGAARPRRAR